jgi:glycosyltransferase involved in cell wall biosynthesis
MAEHQDGNVLVSVIIPLFNAAGTIDRTLLSVRTQTYRALEIIIVDDGSTDDGPDIVRRHASEDKRIQLIQQKNAGVAAARNAGIAAASGEFIAPIDADDLWAPEKTALQLAALMRAGPPTALAYCWYAMIDQADHILLEKRCMAEGNVLPIMALYNIVGNGSSAMMRKAAVAAAGGYDCGLRDRGAEGCEDYTLYFSIAEHAHYALVPHTLVGYRESPANMSSDLRKALRSRDLCIPQFARRHPKLARTFHQGRSRVLRFMLGRSFRLRNWADARFVLREMLRHDPAGGVVSIGQLTVGLVRRWKRSVKQEKQTFTIGRIDR